MIVGIVGLGLIGGSAAKAYKAFSEATVYGLDNHSSTLELACLEKAVDKTLTSENMGDCDFILLALYPQAAKEWLKNNGSHLSPKTIVMDCCGTKKTICATGFSLAKKYGFTFVGGHPMAGSQFSGFKYSKETLFQGASMIAVPEDHNNLDLLHQVKAFLKPLQFGRLTISTVEKHEAMIAFTSQMPHVISNAFIKSPAALTHGGYSAGSLKDFTRVAGLNESLWAELFLENRENLGQELKLLLNSLAEYALALGNNDLEALTELLRQGNICKKEVDAQ